MPFITRGTQTIFYQLHGSGSPLLLIPGLGASHLSWQQQVEKLSPDCQLICADNRDAGRSSGAQQPYRLADMADDMAALIRHLDCGPVTVAGISLGSLIAQQLLFRHPQWVDRLVLISSSAGGPEHSYPAAEVMAALSRQPGDTEERYLQRLFQISTHPSFAAEQPQRMQQLLDDALRFPVTAAAQQRQLQAAMEHYQQGSQEQLTRVTIPVMVIQGLQDRLIAPENGRRLAAALPDCQTLFLPDTGHMPHIEQPETVNTALLHFMQQPLRTAENSGVSAHSETAADQEG